MMEPFPRLAFPTEDLAAPLRARLPRIADYLRDSQRARAGLLEWDTTAGRQLATAAAQIRAQIAEAQAQVAAHSKAMEAAQQAAVQQAAMLRTALDRWLPSPDLLRAAEHQRAQFAAQVRALNDQRAAQVALLARAFQQMTAPLDAGLTIIARRAPYWLCERAAAAVADGDLEALRWFVRHLRLRSTDVWIVAELLWRGGWQHARDPFAYLARAASYQRSLCVHGARRWACVYCAGVGRPGQTREPLRSLTLPAYRGDPDGDILADTLSAEVPHDAGDYGIIVNLLDVERAVHHAGLGEDVQRVLTARLLYPSLTRDDIAPWFQWAPQRAQRAWKAAYRARGRLWASLR
jgi:hypothetical protein